MFFFYLLVIPLHTTKYYSSFKENKKGLLLKNNHEKKPLVHYARIICRVVLEVDCSSRQYQYIFHSQVRGRLKRERNKKNDDLKLNESKPCLVFGTFLAAATYFRKTVDDHSVHANHQKQLLVTSTCAQKSYNLGLDYLLANSDYNNKLY